MENNSKKTVCIILALIILVALICGGYYLVTKKINSSNGEVATSQSTELSIEYTETELSGKYENATAEIDFTNLSVSGSGVTISNNTVTITTGGTFYFTGTTTNGNIVVNASDDDEVIIVLDNCSITSTNTSAINVIEAKNVIVNVPEGAKSTIADSSNYTEFTEDDEPDACIFSKSDLVINGSGKLIVNANYKDGIASKDTLKILNTNIEITSADDAIRGKDCVSIKDSNITIKSEGDGIKSTNTDTEKGYIAISGGSLNIEAESDGIQAESIINISNNPIINIKTSGQVSTSSGSFNKQTTSQETSSSSKGLKAGSEITIEDGTITINSTDDTIHSNGFIKINGGKFELTSGDDGIHADESITINDGEITISKSYEGIESVYIEINGGYISVYSSDDGINAGGGNDSSSLNRPGANSFANTNSNNQIVINGGKVYVNASGDGLDANGSITMNGGDVVVEGPTNDGNGPLDYDASFNITGGTLIAYGSNGMWQNTSTTSTQYAISYAVSGKAGDKLELKDENGNVILSQTTTKAYAQVIFSSPKVENGKTYTLYVNESENASQTVSSIVTTNGSASQGMQGQGGIGGMQGQGGMQAPSDMQNQNGNQANSQGMQGQREMQTQNGSANQGKMQGRK